MKRRKMIRQMAVLAGSLPFFSHKLKGNPAGINFSNGNLDNTLDAIIDTIIPEGKTPGGISLGVPEYVNIMLWDGVSPEQKKTTDMAMNYLESRAAITLGKQVYHCTPEERKQLLKNAFIEAEESEKAGLNLIKSLTIKGYQTSAYFMKQILAYEMAPNRYNGCAPIN